MGFWNVVVACLKIGFSPCIKHRKKKERKQRGLLAICFQFLTSDNWKLRLSSETWGESNLVPFARCWDACTRNLGCRYHLHGKPGNFSSKIKWYASLFHLKYFWKYGLLVKLMHFITPFRIYSWCSYILHVIHLLLNRKMSYSCRKFPSRWFA